VKSASVHPRSIDTSMILFGLLVACAVAALYSAIHFGSARSVKRALITLRERPEGPQPKYLSVLVPPGPSPAAGETEPVAPSRSAPAAQPSQSLAFGR
jgi:hypothetical protein